MNKTKLSTFVLRLVCVFAIAAMALCTFGCEKQQKQSVQTPESTASTKFIEIAPDDKVFDVEVVDGDGNKALFKVATDKEIVGDALQEVGLIEGEEAQYGLYVKKVNGVEADYDKDQTYWAFYVDGEQSMTGVDSVKIEDGKVYSFKVEK